jgi:hypothetical protein
VAKIQIVTVHCYSSLVQKTQTSPKTSKPDIKCAAQCNHESSRVWYLIAPRMTQDEVQFYT